MEPDSSPPGTRQDFLKRAETAFLQGDLANSSKSLRAWNERQTSTVSERAFSPDDLPAGTTAEPLTFSGRFLDSYLVRFSRAVALFDIGVPLLPDGTFYSGAFSHLKYPERYAHLFSANMDAALDTLHSSTNGVTNAYVTLIRPPYYHWLLDTLPHLYGATCLSSLEAINLIAPTAMSVEPWQLDLLSRFAGLFGINNLKFNRLDGTAANISPGHSQTRMPLSQRVDIVRQLMPPGTGRAHRNIFVRRGTAQRRRLHNEEAVLDALGPSFTAVDPEVMDLDSQMQTFAEARCIVGVHGSNLSNIAFCAPGTAVIEIAAGLPQPHFKQLTDTVGGSFTRVMGHPAGKMVSGSPYEQAHGDLTADPQTVKSAVERAIG